MSRTIVVTGSTRGIGFGVAAELARRGHNVVVSGRTDQAVEDAARRIQHLGAGTVLGQAADVTEPDDHERLWATAARMFGRVDIWINNAGVAHTTRDIVSMPSDSVAAMVTTNVYGTIYGSQVAARHMLEQGGGQIFNMLGGGSDGSIRPGMGVYGATKRGLDYFTRALTRELADTPVVVAQIRPGMVVTEGMLREARRDMTNFEKHRRVMNILCDEVSTVAPWLVDRILAKPKHGREISRMTTGRVARKFLVSMVQRPRDLFVDKLNPQT
jgi:NAD(P)-dependent dehydrogenase (short-subunit alcohol dehydrogenase family)